MMVETQGRTHESSMAAARLEAVLRMLDAPERLYQLIQWLEEPVIQPERWQRDVLEALRELREWRIEAASKA